jgi:L-ascorbate metabolism protein UlaG (beta-lactamase superfamily)
MRVQWYGQSAFRLSTPELSVFIDPFDDMSPAAAHGLQFDYPDIDAEADLLLVTHEHRDHNGVDAIKGDPVTLRSTAGRHESPVGEVVGVASEHDGVAGTERGPNTIFVFELDGVRVAHLGDLGQPALRPEQIAAIGEIDLLIAPVGGGPTNGADEAVVLVDTFKPRWVIPMHYRTERVNFLEPADGFLDRMPQVRRFEVAEFDTGELPGVDGTLALVPAAP